MIALTAVTMCYPGGGALRFPDWRVAPGEHWLVQGPSGCGKSTLLALLAGLLTASSGTVEVAGCDLAGLGQRARDRFRGRHVGFVPQEPHLIDTLSVAENVQLAPYLAGLPADAIALARTLESLGIAPLAGQKPHRLSRGQAQRVAVARALVNGPRLLLADEPTANLDDEACADTVDLLVDQASASGAALVIATHDSRVRRRFERQLHLGQAGEAQP